MHRIGVYPHTATPAFVARVASAGLEVESLWTHFARSEEDDATTTAQLRRLLEVVGMLGERPRLLHAANSAATILRPDTHLDLVRPGIAIYGQEPAPGVGAALELRPALSWRSTVTMVKRLPAGEAVSYGHHYRLARDATIATVAVGYEDGYARSLSSRADVLIGGTRHRVAGTVTMDQIMVDCGDAAVAPGDEVVLLGRQGGEEITAAELAGMMGTVNYEIVTSIGERVPRGFRGKTGAGGDVVSGAVPRGGGAS
jgi:alanine racemase